MSYGYDSLEGVLACLKRMEPIVLGLQQLRNFGSQGAGVEILFDHRTSRIPNWGNQAQGDRVITSSRANSNKANERLDDTRGGQQLVVSLDGITGISFENDINLRSRL
jgi:hypothetical protein